MQITATAIMKVDINALEVIEKLIGGYYISTTNKLMLHSNDYKEDLKGWDTEINLLEDEETYYRNLISIKEYLKSKKIKT